MYECFVPAVGFEKYLSKNEKIQVALPNVPKEQREFILSGTSPEGWNRMFHGLEKTSKLTLN